jgi:hypothetical protein
LLTAIESGHHSWLGVAEELRKAADGGARFDLNNALSIALSNNAAGVLDRFGVTYCAGLEAATTRAGAIRLLERKERSVAGVTNPTLAVARQDCLRAIRATREEELPKAQFEK